MEDARSRASCGAADLAKKYAAGDYTWNTWILVGGAGVNELVCGSPGVRPDGAVRAWHPWLRGVYEGKDTGAVKADKLAAKLETIGPGLWEHIDHASTDDPEMRAVGHPGYEWVAADRSANVAAWTSSKVREVIQRRGIKLTSYRDLVKR